eukprot:gnl/MRDRNA2_/MRDRNA2_101958_c0_seq1.p1 gnl/MRDRNA2_/MRDRNA2_101958_c0~~gnl/MRDRNA2_/MRDRNA2_101958_c0_seq1.p1  ORF type:complete len:191 (-),score=34.83 gnl/MRDRNA2_/MRDRNA2_101958_c0_seq1:70-642(-)
MYGPAQRMSGSSQYSSNGPLCFYDTGYTRLHPLGVRKPSTQWQLQIRDRSYDVSSAGAPNIHVTGPGSLEFRRMLGKAQSPDFLVSPEAFELVNEVSVQQHEANGEDRLWRYRRGGPEGHAAHELEYTRAEPKLVVHHSFREHADELRRWAECRKVPGQVVQWSSAVPLQRKARAAQLRVSMVSLSDDCK